MSVDHESSLSALCRALKSGAASVSEVTRSTLQRIERLDPELKAFAMVTPEWAMERAAALDASRAQGQLGPLFGVPIAIKDLLFTKGLPTASGTLVMRDFVPSVNATVVERLLDAGAVIVGKTQLTEGAFGAHHPDISPPQNPYDRNAWPGVSSSGSGVAVAAGLAFGAIGSDTGGSIRFPSACCGLVGIKPTYGRVSRFGGFPLAETLDHFGPMTRCVEDAARMLGVIAGADPNDPTAAVEPVPGYARRHLPVSELRLGVDWAYAEAGVAPTIVERLREVADRLAQLGATLNEVRIPEDYRVLVDGWGITCGVECAHAHAAYFPRHADRYGPGLKALIELGRTTPAEQYDALQRVRARFDSALSSTLKGLHGMLMPTMPVLPPRADVMESGRYESEVPLITFTAPFDYSGHPTITMPVGLSADGLPMSVQVVGQQFGESALVDIGYAIESLFPMPAPSI